MQLNSSQQNAVSHRGGPALVIAGPGSGKTAVITGRTLALINSGVNPENILVITFTRAAADGMRARFMSLCRQESCRLLGCPVFGTFHSIFLDILREETGLGSGSIAGEKDKLRIIKEIIHTEKALLGEAESLAGLLIDEISKVKGKGLPVSEYEPLSCSKEIFIRIYVKYNRLLESYELIDFDDMIIKAYKLLTTHMTVLKKWQGRFRYILIDEFQDVNSLQYRLLLLLGGQSRNLFAVGDDDQAIYGFRGSDPGFMKAFVRDLPDVRMFYLDINYRSSPEITGRAKNLISHNKNRFDKSILSGNSTKGSLIYGEFENVSKENTAVIKYLKSLLCMGIPASEIAVLYRTAGAAGPLITALAAEGISYNAVGMASGLFSGKVFKDINSYLRLASGRRDRADFLRIINKPVRYISREAFSSETVLFKDLLYYYRHSVDVCDNIIKLQKQLSVLCRLRPYAAINYIRKAVGYDEYLKQESLRTGTDYSSFSDAADEIMELASGCKTFDEYFDLTAMMQENDGNNKKEKSTVTDAVTVSTMHRAKGLEYTAVILPDCNEGMVPYKKSKTPDEIEEERRVFYVAVTRAKKMLCICHTRVRYGKDTELSRFVREMFPGKRL